MSNEKKSDEVDWTVFDKPLPSGTPIDPKQKQIEDAYRERLKDFNKKVTKATNGDKC